MPATHFQEVDKMKGPGRDGLSKLHRAAGAAGFEVRVEAYTDVDELSEVSVCEVAVHLPAHGSDLAYEKEYDREAELGQLVCSVAEAMLDKWSKGAYPDLPARYL